MIIFILREDFFGVYMENELYMVSREVEIFVRSFVECR